MDWDERAEQSHGDQSLLWSSRFNKLRDSDIAKWVSKFRDGHRCEVTGDLCGSFNWSCVVKFEDGMQWLVRFAVPGKVMSGDEKVRNEVATMLFVREKTSIPVPRIITWGMSADNTLQLGAFIIMEFVQGEPLNRLLEEPRKPNTRPMLKPDVNIRDLETIYRQVARFLLELSRHDFPQIGSLVRFGDDYLPTSRPLMIKMNEIESHGGVKVGPDISTTFSSTTEFFNHVADQDFRHLKEQPNSADDDKDAQSKFECRLAFQALIPRFVSAQYNHGPFKLFCDDFRLGNMLVNNYEELKIVAVVDWEWSWAAPYQLLYSPPRWLLLKRPIDWDTQRPSNFAERYAILLELFLRVLHEEEQLNEGYTKGSESMSSLMRSAMDDGKFWFHELLLSCFEGAENTAWAAIRQMCDNIDDLSAVTQRELDAFVRSKMDQLAQYNKEWATMKEEREALLMTLRETKGYHKV